jgi:outer membrane immunogenic protein
MKLSHIALGATLSTLALMTSLPPARAAQLDDVLKRLETLEQENASLRNRIQRIEGDRQVDRKAARTVTPTQTTAVNANPAAAYNAVPHKVPPLAAPAFNWTGFYIGGHVGGGRQTTTVEDPFSTFVFGSGFTPGSFVEGVPVRDLHGNGFLGGGQVGWNYQVGQLVVGVEANGSWSDVHAKRTDTITASVSGLTGVFPPFVIPFSNTATETKAWSSDTDWIVSGSTRFGFAWDRWLVYTKGGIAAAHFKYGLTTIDTITSTVGASTTSGSARTFASGSDTRVGFLVGIGGEWMFWNNWSAFVEYNYMGFGSVPVTMTTVGPGGGGGVDTNNIEERIQTVKLGVNLRFAPPTTVAP